MSIWKLIRLNFKQTPAHFGEVGIGLEQTRERVRSDTLFSAWVSSYARLFGQDKVEGLLTQYQQSTPFRHSSTFIYRCQEGKYTYYLPKPLVFPKKYPTDDLEFTKTYKKLAYLPLEVWQRWYQGEGFTESDRNELIDTTHKRAKDTDPLHQAGTFDYNKAFKLDKIPKVAIDRTTRATNFYHTGFVQFEYKPNQHSGLYFLLNLTADDAQLEQDLKAALFFLGEEGLGGERSSGAGRFDVEWLDLCERWKTIKLDEDFSPIRRCLMSLLWEDQAEAIQQLVQESTCYELQERGGWIGSPSWGHQKRRKMVRMFSEGSVFPIFPQGKLADVTPEPFNHNRKHHKIYRSGVSLSLPICI